MKNNFEINSKDYWDTRFASDWEPNQGREQTRFFAELAVGNLPSWLIGDINSKRYTIGDVGCAEGDAVPILNNKFFKSKVSGIDFSAEAIERAKQYYPNYEFHQGAIEDFEEPYDVLFCSNVLEHFVNPFDMLEKMLTKTNKHLILLLPFQEYDRVKEHFFTFDYEHFPLNLGDFRLSFYKEIDGAKYEHKLWPLKQILIVYSRKELISDLDISLESFSSTVPTLEKELREVYEDFKKVKENYEEKIEKLKNELSLLEENYRESKQQYEKLLVKSKAKNIENENLRNEVQEIEQLNHMFNAQKDQKVEELNSIYNSRLWKLAKPYYNFRNKRNPINRLLNFTKRHGVKETVNVVARRANDQTVKKVHSFKHKAELHEILKIHEGKKIIVFPPLVDWNIPLYQRPQHIALNLAEKGYLYFFCTANMQYDNIGGFEKLSDSCYVTNRFDLLQTEIDSKILHLYSTDMNPHKDLIDSTIANGNKILYEYIDEIHEDLSGPIPIEVMQKHERLLKDEENCIAIGSADKLYEDILKYRSKNMKLVTNGVEYEHFHINKDTYSKPSEIWGLIKKGKPIIGYFGAFATWFDYELVIKLAKERPEYEILLIGWNYDNSIKKYELEKYNNIKVIGPIQYKELPKYAVYFSVSTIPFMINDITESTSPIKLFEYMALGHPIVTTDMPECRKYESVLIGHTHEEFVEKIDEALTLANDKKYNDLLLKEAHENTWSAKARAIHELL
ncbi:methyltransferase domain-containing protein [Lysinibacillus capsici]|uniref:methyltransferase domain-containing protein n=1 Tax=Lysinibacillus capsici TaxID=2115968 RepID=UPI0024810B1D|nr:methyltransferase domain-containing protein [Lysinibacillus capsici]